MNEIRPQLTISLLISNRIETIPRCLDSLKPIMSAIPCELILIDTSKNDAIHNLLLEYTNQVYEFEWCNDFAKARNEGLKRSRGEWFMFLDDDEWFADSSALIEFFKSGEYRKYNYADYQVRNFKDTEYVYYDDCWLARLFRIEDNSCFVRKIHEQFSPMKGAEKYIPAMVYHSGYIYATPEDRRKHFERNHALLLDMIKEEPDNIYWWLQLTQEYSYVGEHDELISYCKKCLKKIADVDTPYINNQRGAFCTGLATGYIRRKKYAECIEFAKKILVDKRTGKVLEAMMRLRLAEAYLSLDQVDNAEAEVKKYLNITESIDLNDPQILEQSAVFLVGDAFNKNSAQIAYAVLICCGLKREDAGVLAKYYEKLEWSNSVVYTMEGIEKYLVDAMWNLPYEPIFTQVVIDAFDKDNLRNAFRKELVSREPINSTVFPKIVHNLADTMQRVVDNPGQNILEYRETLEHFVQSTSEWYDFVDAEIGLAHWAENTPPYILAAINIADYFELESKTTVSSLGKLKNAVEAMPEFAKSIGQFLDRYNELQEQRMVQQRKEMDTLRIQVISQVKTMIETGQNEAAVQIMQQLKMMFPEDKEIEILQKSIES